MALRLCEMSRASGVSMALFFAAPAYVWRHEAVPSYCPGYRLCQRARAPGNSARARQHHHHIAAQHAPEGAEMLAKYQRQHLHREGVGALWRLCSIVALYQCCNACYLSRRAMSISRSIRRRPVYLACLSRFGLACPPFTATAALFSIFHRIGIVGVFALAWPLRRHRQRYSARKAATSRIR